MPITVPTFNTSAVITGSTLISQADEQFNIMMNDIKTYIQNVYGSVSSTLESEVAAALTQVETIYDEFSDIYLGAKAVDPTLDNDGNALIIGAMYFNTTSAVLKTYSGTAWIASLTLDVYTKSEVQSSLPAIGLNTTLNTIPSTGQFTWNTDESTVNIGLPFGVTGQVFQEQFIPVKNQSGITILNGRPVMAIGTTGNSGKVLISYHNGLKVSAKNTIGFSTHDITNGSDGLITVSGKIRNINTTGSTFGETWADGDVIYIKPNTTGMLTNVEPLDTELKMPIAFVIHSHTNGTLLVRTTPIDENHDRDLLLTKLDKNSSISAGTGTKVTYDSKGLVTSSTTLSSTDIPNLDASKITTGTLSLNTTGSAATLTTARTIATSGDATGTATSFDGSSNITIPLTLATVTDSGSGTFKKITRDTKGRVTGTQSVVQADITGLLGAGSISNTMLANSAVANLSGTNTGDETTATIKTKLGITTLSGSNTGDQTITLTGDVTGSGTGSFATTLANSGVTSGTYKSVTVDGKGRVTSGTNPTTLAGYSISDAYSKTEIDTLVQGFKPKAEVKVATTVNIILSGTQTIDGVSVLVGDRVLVKNQSTGSQNGIYVASATAWSRATDSDSAVELSGSYCFVSQGSTQVDSGWYMNTDNITLDSTSLTWIQFTGSGAYTPISHVGSTGASHGVATTSVNGFMSSTDKTKLDGIASGAQVNIATDLSLGTITSTTIPLNSSTGADVTLPAVTTSLAGLMTSSDKTKLDGIASGATANTGTVTSVATSGAITGGTITTSGTISHSTADGYLHVPATSTTNNGKVLTAGATAGSLSWTTVGVGTVTSVGGTGTVSGLTLTGTVTSSGNLTLGGTLSVLPSNFASQTANTVLAAPNGSAGVPTFRAIVTSDIPTLNQNTTGSAGSVVASEIIKFDTGTTEGTDLYTFNGSTAKTIDIKAGTNVTLTKTTGSITINANDTSVTWSEITSKPTTVSGYGITDAMTTAHSANAITGLGATTTALTSGGTGTQGVSTVVARQDHTHTLPAYPTTLPASDVYAWAKAATKPAYTASEVGLGNVTNESKSTMFTNAALTGTPTAPTPATTVSSTQIATTAFATPRTDATGASVIPAGTTAQRPASPSNGYLRYNTDTLSMEAYVNGSWGAVGGGASGGGVFYENSLTVASDYTITSGKSAMSTGDITINTGITVTVPSGSKWVIL